MIEITKVRIEKHFLEYKQPIRTFHGEINKRSIVLLALQDQKGRWGYGEASPLKGFSRESTKDAESGLIKWSRSRNRQSLEGLPSAIAALDSAFLDLASQEAAVSLHEFLEPESSKIFPVAKLLTGNTGNEIELETLKALKAGFSTIKLKVGNKNPKLDLSRVKAARSIGGADLSIRLDANGAWEVNEAVDNLGQLSEMNLEFVEEPSKGLEKIAAVRSSTTVPIAVDESIGEIVNFKSFIDLKPADVVVIKPSSLGGLTNTSKLILEAKDSGLKVIVTSLLDGAIGVMAAAHLVSAHGLNEFAHGLATSSLLSVDIATQPIIKEGNFYLPDTPGLGISFN